MPLVKQRCHKDLDHELFLLRFLILLKVLGKRLYFEDSRDPNQLGRLPHTLLQQSNSNLFDGGIATELRISKLQCLDGLLAF